MNISEAFFYQCRLNPFGTAIGVADNGLHSLKYTELERLIHGAAAFALNAKLDRRTIAGIAISQMTVHLALTLALARLGIPSVALSGATMPPSVKVDVVFHDGQIPRGHTGAAVLLDPKSLEGADSTESPVQRIDGWDICRLFLSTDPLALGCAIPLTHHLITARIHQFGYVAGRLSARASRVLCGFGVDSWQGFACTMHALSTGGAVYFPAEDAAASLQSLELFQLDGLYTSANELEAMLQFFEANSTLECSLQFVVCEGSLQPAVIERVRKRICGELFFVYGSTETALVSSGPAELRASVQGAVGFLCPGVDAHLLNKQLVVRSPYLPASYVGGKRTVPPFFRDGAFYTGLSAEVTSDGILAFRENPAERPPQAQQ
jgi:acyl-coenzyme A synthetase/AMP-(fatty) acid ligase